MPRPLIAGNWKMNTTFDEARSLASEIVAGARFDLDLIVCPPFPWLPAVHQRLAGSAVRLGAQNCWVEPAGAFTGEVAPEMLADMCDYVIVGHSERRTIFGESNELVGAKVRAALRAGLQPIVCVGETLAVRQEGEAQTFVSGQIQSALGGLERDALDRCVVAYEPIWAIGTGAAATPADIQAMSSAIRTQIAAINAETALGMRILYGGSVTPSNFGEIMSCPDIDGALVGGASLEAERFLRLAEIASD